MVTSAGVGRASKVKALAVIALLLALLAAC